MDEQKRRSAIQELLAILYLRLNGYMTSGFIIHSKGIQGNNGEIDIIGVRFPLHRQDETEHNSSPYLEIPKDEIDIIIGEVKSGGQRPQFNRSLQNPDNFQKLLRWVGLFDEETISHLSAELVDLITPKENSKTQNFLSTKSIKSISGKARIRPMIFNLEPRNSHGQDKYVSWAEVNDFIWNCLCPAETRNECSIRYDFNAWGYGINEIVKVYKDKHRNTFESKPQTIDELYSNIDMVELAASTKVRTKTDLNQ